MLETMVVLKLSFSFVLFAVSLAWLNTHCCAKTADEWKGRIIYQLLTDRFAPSGILPDQPCTQMRSWCGGTFQGIKRHLDYITGLGANAIWISPIVLNTPGGFHGYWAKDIYQIQPHFGSKEDLKSLVQACHDRDVWVMADLVANHMGYPPGVDWTTDPNNASALERYDGFVPFNKSEYFHRPHAYVTRQECRDQWKIENYWLFNLPDLNQSHPFVEETLLKWVQSLTAEYGFDGYRLDTVIQVPKAFWVKFQKAGGVFMLGEANNGPPGPPDFCGPIEYVAGYQGTIDSVLDFPMYWYLRYIFQEKNSNFTLLSQALNDSYRLYKDRSILGGFVDNHDHPRFLNINPSWKALRNELTYVLTAQWIPLIYYGTEQGFNGAGDPNNRESLWPHLNPNHELYKFIQILTAFRKSLGRKWLDSAQQERFVEPNVYGFSRGVILVFVTNQDETRTVNLTNHQYDRGVKLVNVLNSSQTFSVSQEGKLTVVLTNGEPLVLRPLSGTSEGNLLGAAVNRIFAFLICYFFVMQLTLGTF